MRSRRKFAAAGGGGWAALFFNLFYFGNASLGACAWNYEYLVMTSHQYDCSTRTAL